MKLSICKFFSIFIAVALLTAPSSAKADEGIIDLGGMFTETIYIDNGGTVSHDPTTSSEPVYGAPAPIIGGGIGGVLFALHILFGIIRKKTTS